MDPITQQTALACAGAAGGEALYADDVFNTYLWTGSTSTENVENGIDLSTEGGLVWIKNRSYFAGRDHVLYDTERGANKVLKTNSNSAESTLGASGTLTFNTDGYDVPSGDGDINGNGFGKYCGWTFRKAPGFFDVVTYTGNGSSTGDSQTISHNLGSIPGFVIIKRRLSGTGDWVCWHRSISTGQPTKYIELDSTNGTGTMGVDIWGTVSSTEFEVKHNGTVGDSYEINKNGETYVAYFFAHDDQSFGDDSNEAIIKCGSYLGTGSAGHEIDLGFEAQWVMLKNVTDSGDNWEMADIMRGQPASTVSTDGKFLRANSNATESSNYPIHPNPTGFTIQNTGGGTNAFEKTYIYIAIRRPHKPPTDGTDVFKPVAATNGDQATTTGFVADHCIWGSRGSSIYNFVSASRLTGKGALLTTSTAAQNTGYFSDTVWQTNDGMNQRGVFSSQTSTISWFFKRAPGFFDVVAYPGNSTAGRTVSHNLGVKPELMIVKARSGATNQNWFVYNSNDTATDYMLLNGTDASDLGPTVWNNTEPTSSVFTVGLSTFTNASGYEYIAYLFATLDGISKVGTYPGTGNNVDVDCGFSAGARFVMIKRTDADGPVASNWYVFDTARGIASGNDPFVYLNATTSEDTSSDYIDPLNSGFRVTSNAGDDLNKSGGTYLFLAIA